ncbi:unnamed protein product, partial [Protopolystoma xenopodis]
PHPLPILPPQPKSQQNSHQHLSLLEVPTSQAQESGRVTVDFADNSQGLLFSNVVAVSKSANSSVQVSIPQTSCLSLETNFMISQDANSLPPRVNENSFISGYSWADAVLQLLEAAKAGDLEMVRRLITAHQEHQHDLKSICLTNYSSGDGSSSSIGAGTSANAPSGGFIAKLLGSSPQASFDLINCRDIDGRHSTPLHFAAGYNRLAVVELLLQFGADVHAKDKGGLVPLHNACSYGHVRSPIVII